MLGQRCMNTFRNTQSIISVTSKRNAYEKPSIILHKDVVDAHKKERIKDLIGKDSVDATTDPDMPIQGMFNPFQKPSPRCILCEQNISLDYKNVRLLSQFTSSYTGRIYDRGVTGLCLFMQKRVAKLIKRARMFGYMPYEIKDPRYVQDPKLFDPFKRRQ